MRRWVRCLLPLSALAAVAACTAFSAADGSADAGTSTSFCLSRDAGTGTVVFCDDFDAPGRSAFEIGCYQSACWTHFDSNAVGQLITDGPYSAPRAARLSSAVDAGDGGVRASRGAGIVTIAFPADKTTLTMSAMIRPHGAEGLGERVFAVTYGSCFVDFAATGGLGYATCPATHGIPGAPNLQSETWTRVSLALKRTAQGETVRLVVGDGATAIVTTGDILAGDGGVPTSAQLIIGNAANNSTYVIDYDDVLVVLE
jgi:hypothetical protein